MRKAILTGIVDLTLIAFVLIGATAAIAQSRESPTLSELERAKVEIINLQSQLSKALAEKADCYAVLGPLQAQANTEIVGRSVDALKAELAAKHPDFEWDPQTGAFTPKKKPETATNGPTPGKKPGGVR